MPERIPSFDWETGWKISLDNAYLYFGDEPPDYHSQEVFLSEYFLRNGKFHSLYRDRTLGMPYGWSFKVEDIVSKLQAAASQSLFPQAIDLVSFELIEPSHLSGPQEREFLLELKSLEEVRLFLAFFTK